MVVDALELLLLKGKKNDIFGKKKNEKRFCGPSPGIEPTITSAFDLKASALPPELSDHYIPEVLTIGYM